MPQWPAYQAGGAVKVVRDAAAAHRDVQLRGEQLVVVDVRKPSWRRPAGGEGDRSSSVVSNRTVNVR
jgi:hypothetical protein